MLRVLIWHAKTPVAATTGVFYSVLAGWLMPWADYRLIFSVQPLANIVSNYTCRNGEKKC